MTEVIYESEFITVTYENEKRLVETVWKEINIMSDEEVMMELIKLTNLITKRKPLYALTDESNRGFGYSPELQRQMTNYLNDSFKNLHWTTKSAAVASKDWIAKLSLNQLNDESKSVLAGVKIFDNREDALKWLFEE